MPTRGPEIKKGECLITERRDHLVVEEHLRDALDAAQMGRWRADLQTGQGTRDANLNRILGLEAVPTTQPIEDCFRLVHPEDKPAALAAWQRCRDTQGVYETEFRIIRDDGSKAWLRETGRFIKSQNGQPDLVTGLTQDITARKQAEEALRHRERDLNDFFETAAIGLHWVGPDGIILRVNQSELDMLGYERDEYLGRHIAEFHVDQDVIEDMLARLTRGETLREHPARMRCKNGSIRHVLVNSSVQFDNGEFIHTRCFTIDVTDRKRAEMALRESEERLQSIFTQTLAGIAKTDLTGRFVQVNARYCEIVGRTAEELYGLRMQDITHPDDLTQNLPLFKRAVTEGVPFVIEKRYVRPGGSLVWVNNSVSLIRDENGAPKHIAAVSIDISDRKHIEEALRENEQQLQMVISAGKFGHWQLDLADQRMTASAKCRANYGRSPDEPFTYELVRAAIHPEDQDSVDVAIRRAIETVGDYQADYRILWPDGSLHWINARGRAIADESGQAAQMTGVTLEITDRKQAEEQLREQEAQYRSIFESTSDAFLIFDYDGRLIEANPAGCEMHGYSHDEFVGMHGGQFVHPDDHHKFADFVRQVATGEQFYVEGTHVRKDGQPISIQVNGTSFVFRGRPALLAVVRDVTEEKRAVEALRERQDLLDRIVAGAPVAIAVMRGPDLEFVSANPAYHAIRGPDVPLIGRRYRDIFPEAADRGAEESLREVMRTGRAWKIVDFETEVPDRAGLTWWEGEVLPLPNQRGENDAVLVLTWEITDRKQHEVALRRSAETFAALVEQSPLGIYTVDADFRIANVSAGSAPAFRNVQPVIGRDFAEVMHAIWPEPFASEAIAIFRRVLETGEPYISPGLTEKRKDIGEIESYEWQVNRVTLADGRPGVVCYYFDATRLQQANQAVQESEARFRAMADNIPQLAWMADGEGWIFWYNQQWYDYTGTNLEQMQGWGWKAVHHPDHIDRVVEKVARHFREGLVWEDTFPLRGRDGQYRWFLSRMTPIRDESGKVLLFFGTNTDVTEQRAAEQALRDADRRKNEFLALLAHELRNPLAPISNAVQVLRLTHGNGESIASASEMMERQVGQLVRLVDDLLDVSRISRGKIELRQARVDLQSIVHQAAEAARPLVQRMNHHLTVTLSSQPIYLNGDPTRLTQVVGNLLNNACKFTDKGGRIWLTVEVASAAASAHRNEAVIRVRDSGIGMASDQLPRIFEMFTQVDTSLERTQTGLGIGLTLVKKLVEMHGGTVEVHSEGVGQGSEFVVRLPTLVESAPPPPEPTASEPTTRTGRRILVVDDNRDSATSLAMLLRMTGHETYTAYDGLEAVEAAAMSKPDVVLLDIGLPKLNGYEACRRIREQPGGQAMVLIALTGWGQEEDRQRSREAGFDGHLVKPVDLAVLTKLLAEVNAG